MASTSEDTGIAKRGLLLLGLMTVLAAVVLLIIFQRPSMPAKVDGPAEPERQPSAPGWEIRYNAALALARRGSDKTPWPLVRQMLDVEQQRGNFRVQLKSGQVVADEDAALRTVYNTLAALAEWHKKQDAAKVGAVPEDLQLVYAEVDRLAQSPHAELRVQADRVRQTFFRK